MAWPEGTGKRVFVYVKTDLAQLDELIDTLASGPHRVVAYIPGLDEKRRAKLTARKRVVSERPVKLERFIRSCDLVICHAGEIATGALMNGVPSLNFPSHYEQLLTARRLQMVGAAGWIPPQSPQGEVARGVRMLLEDPRYAANARAFAQRYPAFSPQEQRRRIVVRIEELLGTRAAILPATSSGETRR